MMGSCVVCVLDCRSRCVCYRERKRSREKLQRLCSSTKLCSVASSGHTFELLPGRLSSKRSSASSKSSKRSSASSKRPSLNSELLPSSKRSSSSSKRSSSSCSSASMTGLTILVDFPETESESPIPQPSSSSSSYVESSSNDCRVQTLRELWRKDNINSIHKLYPPIKSLDREARYQLLFGSNMYFID